MPCPANCPGGNHPHGEFGEAKSRPQLALNSREGHSTASVIPQPQPLARPRYAHKAASVGLLHLTLRGCLRETRQIIKETTNKAQIMVNFFPFAEVHRRHGKGADWLTINMLLTFNLTASFRFRWPHIVSCLHSHYVVAIQLETKLQLSFASSVRSAQLLYHQVNLQGCVRDSPCPAAISWILWWVGLGFFWPSLP